MNAFQCLRLAARPSTRPTTLGRPTLTRPQRSLLTPRQFSLLAPRRPILPLLRTTGSLPTPGSAASLLPSSSATLDLAGKISAHPGLGSTQIRSGPRDTYNPSHIVRKRRHGFLSRIRTKKGRKMIMRRLKKGRWNISH